MEFIQPQTQPALNDFFKRKVSSLLQFLSLNQEFQQPLLLQTDRNGWCEAETTQIPPLQTPVDLNDPETPRRLPRLAVVT